MEKIREYTADEIRRVIDVLPGIVEKLRAMSPLYQDMLAAV